MKKVLVADDNPDILWVVEFLLKKNGFDVVSILDGKNVLEQIVSNQPDLVLLDVFLAGLDGREVCNSIKATDQTKNIPVIMFSAHTNLSDVMQVCDADDFVSKPFDSQYLIEKINQQIALKPRTQAN